MMSLQNTSFFFLDGKTRARVRVSFQMEDPMLETISLRLPCLCARATSIPIRHEPVVIRFRTPAKKDPTQLKNPEIN